MSVSPWYQAYLQSPEWAEQRKRKLQQTDHHCQGCGSDERLEVHHLTYDRVGHERSEDLMVLCHFCHAYPLTGGMILLRDRADDLPEDLALREILREGLDEVQDGLSYFREVR